MMKKIALFLFAFLGLLFTYSLVKINVNATTSGIAMTEGAAIRTTGTYQGIKFQATVTSLPEDSTHGFYVVIGEYTVSDMTTAIASDATTIGGNKLVKKEIVGTNNTFNLVIYDIPETSYTQDITVVAYVKLSDGTYEFTSAAVTRNISEVAVAAYDDGDASEFVGTIYRKAKATTFNLDGGTFVANQTLNITHYNTGANTGVDNITLAPRATQSSGSGLYWIKVAIKTYDADNNIFTIVSSLNSGTAISTISSLDYDYVLAGWSGKAGENALLSLTTLNNSTPVYIKLSSLPTVTGEVSVTGIVVTNVDLLTGNKVYYEANATLPTAVKTAYTFNGWYIDSGFSGSVVTTHAVANTAYYAKYTATPYSISYQLNGGTQGASPTTSYTIESNDITLPTPTITDGTFDGWYDNSSFTGSAITTISSGSYGNKTFYAKWIMNAPTIVDLSDADEIVLNTIIPDIVVSTTFNAGTYKVNGNNYVFGSAAFSTISAAVAAASANNVIYVFAGTYSDELTIATASIKIYGPNYNVNGYATRSTEAIVSGLTTITGASVIIDGLKFIGSGAIKVSANSVIINHIYMNATQIACNGNNRKGCIVDGANISNLSVLNSYINAPGTANSYAAQFMSFTYVNNLTIKGNYITNTSQTTLNTSYGGMRIYTAAGTLNIEDNEFAWGTNGYVMLIGTNTNSCTAINILDNTFIGCGTNANKTLGIYKASSSCTTTIRGNQFNKFQADTFSFSGDTGSTIKIEYNYFSSDYTFTCSIIGSAKITTNYNCYAGGITAVENGHNPDTTAETTYSSLEALNTAYALYLGN